MEWNRNPYTISDATFAEVWDMALKDRIASPKGIAQGTVNCYRIAFNRLAPLHDRPLRALSLQELQDALDSIGNSRAAVELQLVVIQMVYKFATRHDMVPKDYSQYLQARTGTEDEKGEPFTDEELAELKRHTDNKCVRQILCLCYTGFRVAAYQTMRKEGDVLIGGVKTKASKDRTVPIHPAIADWIDETIGINSFAFRKAMHSTLADLGLRQHTPHDCRHTFSYLCDKYGVEPFTKRMLLGHSLGTDVTDQRYGHRSVDQLRAAIGLLVF